MNTNLSRFFLFYPVRFLRGERIIRHLKTVKLIESGTIKDIETYQQGKLKEIISYAYQNIPYYRKILKDFVESNGSINKFKDMEKVPVLTKAIIRKNVNQLKSNKSPRYDMRTTSGSMGEPLKFYKDRNAVGFMAAVMYNVYSWHNLKIGDKQARFWGIGLDMKTRYKQKLKDLLMNRIRISAFNLDEPSLFKNYNRLLEWKPVYFYGYPSLISEFASFVEKNNLSTNNFRPRVVIVTGELLLESDRQK